MPEEHITTVERRFTAMGTTVQLLGIGTGNGADVGELLACAEERVRGLEARWSRFRPTSELSRVNERAGTPTVVTVDTFDLLSAAVDGWYATAGRFDPTLLDAVVAAGYDRTFTEIPADRGVAEHPPTATPGRGCAAVILDPAARTVTLPPGTRLDLGGIAKGRAADLVVADLAAAGLEGACANLGGDARVWGRAPDGDAWQMAIEDPTSDAPLARLELDDGAIVTSTRLRRRWRIDGVEQHHLIDPRTGRPAFGGWAQVSVIAGTATEAEVLSKALFLDGPQSELLAAHAARAVLVADDGRVVTAGFDPSDDAVAQPASCTPM